MLQFRLALLILLVSAMTIIVVQNTDVVTVRVLLWDLEMSRIVVIVAPFLVGCAAGVILASLVRARSARPPVARPRPDTRT